jgi:hypothetical protein
MLAWIVTRVANETRSVLGLGAAALALKFLATLQDDRLAIVAVAASAVLGALNGLVLPALGAPYGHGDLVVTRGHGLLTSSVVSSTILISLSPVAL